MTVLDDIKTLLGPGGYIDDPADMAPYLTEWRDRWTGTTPLVARPKNTEEVAGVVRLCAETRTPIVPQGGHTGLCGGAMPSTDGSQIILSLARLNRVRALDETTITVEAGCTLAQVQNTAAGANLLFPLSLASEGSAQIGGVLSTNAGGNAVLRYGTARALTLGLEVVLPSGGIWHGLKALGKDNTGYDLKHLFIGAEGTLGIITAATLKLFPRPRQTATLFAGLPSVETAVSLLHHMTDATGGRLSAFELISRRGLEIVTRHMPGCRDPLTATHPWYVLMEATTSEDGNGLAPMIEQAVAHALDEALITDAAIAQSDTQQQDFWRLRDSLSEAQKYEGGSIKHDVSVPVPAIPRFIDAATTAVTTLVPGCRLVPFGHIGDGNIHFNVSQPPEMDTQAFLECWDEMNCIVHDIVMDLEGSISAEHGIGQAKRDEMTRYKSPVELDLMRRIKQALDPQGIMNPGKVVPP